MKGHTSFFKLYHLQTFITGEGGLEDLDCLYQFYMYIITIRNEAILF